MRLFHFSEDPTISVFEPRPVAKPAPRRPGQEWLNGPLVWAIEEAWSSLYLFPRDCPRILLKLLPHTTAEDRRRWFGDADWTMVAYIEAAWWTRLETARLYRYELPASEFENLDDAGMWIARRTVQPLGMTTVTGLPGRIHERGVDLRVVDDLSPLKGVWATSLHASGIRLRNARGWSDGAAVPVAN